MGNSNSRTPFLEDDPESWKVNHVCALYAHYSAKSLDFGLHRSELENFIDAVIPDEAGDVVGKVLWPRFAEYNDGKEVNALELLAGLTVISLGTVEQKFDLLFQIFDLNQTGSMSYDEFCLALSSTLAGTGLYLRRGALTSDQAMEPHTDAAFFYLNKDTSSRLSRNEIWDFLESKHFPHLCHSHAIARINSPVALLACFDLTDNFIPDSSTTNSVLTDSETKNDESSLSSSVNGGLTLAKNKAPSSRRRDLFQADEVIAMDQN